jgi:hypothetical protein
VAFDAHLPAAHGVAFDVAFSGDDVGLAGKAEWGFEMFFGLSWIREETDAFSDFDDALFALAIFLARGGDVHADLFGIFEEGLFGPLGFSLMSVDCEDYSH